MTNKVATREVYKGYGILVKTRNDGMFTGSVTKPGGGRKHFIAESALLCTSYCEDYIDDRIGDVCHG